MTAAQEHVCKGQAYVKAGRTEAAIAEFQQAVYLDPSHQYAGNELSKALAEWQKQQKQDESEMERLKRKAKEAAPGRVAPPPEPALEHPDRPALQGRAGSEDLRRAVEGFRHQFHLHREPRRQQEDLD